MAPGPDRAVVFQEPALFPWLTALENVEIGLEAAGIPSAARRARALDMLTLTGLSGRENQIPAELSGGQKQRVSARSGIGPIAARTARTNRSPLWTPSRVNRCSYCW